MMRYLIKAHSCIEGGTTLYESGGPAPLFDHAAAGLKPIQFSGRRT